MQKTPLLVYLIVLFTTPLLSNYSVAARGADSDSITQQLISLRHINHISLAPDEKQVAVTRNVPRNIENEQPGPDWQELYLIKRNGKVIPLITGFNQIESLQWSHDNQQLWMLMRRQDEPYFSVYMIRLEGGEAIKVLAREQHIYGFALHSETEQLVYWQPAPENAKSAPHELNAVIAFEREPWRNHQVWWLSLETPQEGARQLTDSGHILQAQFSPNGKQLLLKQAPSYLQDDETMRSQYLLSDLNGNTKPIVSGMGKLDMARFSPDGKHLAFIAAETPDTPDHGSLFVVDLAKQQIAPALTDFSGMVTDISWSESREILFAADVGVRSIIATTRADKASERFSILYDGPLIVRQLDSQGDYDNFVATANSQSHPNELFWYRKRKLHRFTDSNPELHISNGITQQVIEFTAEDGLALEGVLISPKAHSNKIQLATVIFVHGGPESHISDGWLARHQYPVYTLAELGIQSFFPNYRGSSGRGTDFLKAGQGDYAGAEFNDLLAAKNALLQRDLSAPRFAIVGASYGGYAAAWGATRFSEHFDAAIAISGIANKLSKFGTTDIPSEMLQTHALSQPWESWQSWLKSSPIYYSDMHKTPILIMHGQRDTRVHYSQSLELYRHLKTRNQAKTELLLYPEQGHQVIDAHTQLDLSKRIVAWLAEHLLEND